MIQPGIKIGPNDWKLKLTQTNARFCEVWFNVLEENKYASMFSYLRKHKINTGLHFWGTIDNHWEPNIAYPGKQLQQTLKIIEKTIDIAAKNKFHYVNIHCGNRAQIKINLTQQIFLPDKNFPIISLKASEKIQANSLKHLNKYAKSKKVLFLTETVGAKTGKGSLNKPESRLNATDYFTLPVSSLIKNAQRHKLFVTNDICHTFADDYDKPLNKLWQALWQKTKALAPMTKLLHINTVVPPYNGTDSHHGITKADYQIKGIFPTRQKLKKYYPCLKTATMFGPLTNPKTSMNKTTLP